MSRSRLLSLTVCLSLLTPAAAAQEWVELVPGAAPGTPATVTLGDGSSATVTRVDITIPGFWKETVTVDGVAYDRLDFPGLEGLGQVGAPDLPVVRVNIATAGVGNLVYSGVEVDDTAFVEGILPLPTYVPGEDEEFDPTWDPGPGDVNGTDPQWSYDPATYAGTFPSFHVGQEAFPTETMLGGIQGARVEIRPVRYSVQTGGLQVKRSLSLTFTAFGAPGAPLFEITKPMDQEASVHFVNWIPASFYWPYDTTQYHSRYLIVAPETWWAELLPFVALKKSQGYQVSVVEAAPTTDDIRAAIASWYHLGDPGTDHYALLVGDTDIVPLPLIFEPGVAVRSDRPYGCVGDLDASREVYVGRISVDNTTDLTRQLEKIIEYQVDPAPGDYHEALLVSHKEEAPLKYTGSHMAVRDATYSHPPTFLTLFGETGVDNQDVFDAITDGVGLVAYRGHGSTTSWSEWNAADESFHKNHLGSDIVNPVRPVVWQIACTNSNLLYDSNSTQDCISEVWLEVENGAVASYGATQGTSTVPNHHLNEKLFEMVYDKDVTTHAKAIELAEQAVWTQWAGHMNPWAYLLLGDPSMKIRRLPVIELGFSEIPTGLTLSDAPEALTFSVDTSTVDPDEALVSVYKQSFLAGGPDEVLGAYWTDPSGSVVVPVDLDTPGTLLVTVSDAEGNVSTEEVPIAMGDHWTDLGEELAGAQGAPRLAGTGELAGGQPWSLLLTNTPPSAFTLLCYGLAEANLPFYGGTLVPAITHPSFVVPVGTNEAGDFVMESAFPEGLPADLELYFQFWVVDPSGPLGATASNAIRGTTG